MFQDVDNGLERNEIPVTHEIFKTAKLNEEIK